MTDLTTSPASPAADERTATAATATAPTATGDSATSDRVAALVASMTLEEKLAQITGFWEKSDGEVVAPLQGSFAAEHSLGEALRDGIGHLTRVYGTRPVDPVERARWLWETQRRLVRDTRLGIPALVHEECLTGFAAWGAATYPTPLAWGAAGDPDLVERMAAAIGGSMRALGVHQGLAPVLDVVRDPRWGRVEECIAEDPYLVGSLGTAYVRGLQAGGVHATLKHFVGYSASQAGRNFAPVHAGPRELADVLLVPFEMAVLDGGARSVMHAYTDLDGVPTAADRTLLTDLLRGRWGFDGTLVADYFGVAFLHLLHRVAEDLADAAGQALEAGVDIELPHGDAYRGPLAAGVRDGRVSEDLVDLAVLRALRQKEELGLLDAVFDDEPPEAAPLDDAEQRALARELAEKSVVLVANDGVLPLAGRRRVAVLGPNADRSEAMFGCYSFVNHVLAHHPDVEPRLVVPTVLEAVREELDGVRVDHLPGCGVDDDDTSRIPAAVALAAEADVAVVVVGDQAGLFSRGTVGEGRDTDDLELPGVQRTLVEEVLDTGTPVVLVLLTGRPYAVGWALERCAAVVQAFFPGEEGGSAVAGVLSGRVNPSGRLPVSLPRSTGAQPYSYLHSSLGGPTEVTNLSSAPVAAFGHGLSYTTFGYDDLSVDATAGTAGPLRVEVTVRNRGDRPGEHVVQLYGHDPVASVARPVAQLLGYRRVALDAGAAVRVGLEVPAARLAFTGRDLVRGVEPGELELWVGSSAERVAEAVVRLDGERHPVGPDCPRVTRTSVAPLG